jgi:hypothetical protein
MIEHWKNRGTREANLRHFFSMRNFIVLCCWVFEIDGSQ